ncbi:hypothetical protein WN943_001584 [Citrus x changshan-huyou]
MELCNLETCANDHFLNEMSSNGSYPLSFFGKSFNLFDKRLRIHTKEQIVIKTDTLEFTCNGMEFVFQCEHHSWSFGGEADALGNAYCSRHILLLLWSNRWESAREKSQKYKEGKFVLERGRIVDEIDFSTEVYIDTRPSVSDAEE